MLAIAFGGPFLSSELDEKYRKQIDKNSAIVPGIVYQKKSHKGNTVHFKYRFQSRTYKNNEQNDLHYDALDVGDSILVKVDTLEPSKSYISSY